ncbi:hypothetical protein B7494_g974 [Chlorociboria aeruginascens]|nr:hypothetical protein B7494_g974 [Chlorociboria aeruginascens]
MEGQQTMYTTRIALIFKLFAHPVWYPRLKRYLRFWVAPKYFPQFSKLPMEIRLQIWRACFPPPRMIEMYPREQDFDRLNIPQGHSVPIILSQVNQESRHETLLHFKLISAGFYKNLSNGAKNPIIAAVNPRTDIIVMDSLNWRYHFNTGFLKSVKKWMGEEKLFSVVSQLAVVRSESDDEPMDADFPLPNEDRTNLCILKYFTGLKKIYIYRYSSRGHYLGQVFSAEDFRKHLLRYFKQARRKHPVYRIPEIIVSEDIDKPVVKGFGKNNLTGYKLSRA